MFDKGLKLVALNIRSLYPSIDEVKCKFSAFDCIGISETWLNESYTDNLVSIDTFTLYRLDREAGNILNHVNKNKCGGGLIMYIGSKYKGHSEQITECCSITIHLEQLWVILNKPNTRKMAICFFI